MHFSLFSTMPDIVANPTTFTVMIAALACILGAEIAGVCILISKMVRARRSKIESSYEDGDQSFRNYSVCMLLFLGTIPQSTYVALSVLVTATAAMAVLFAVLLVVFRVCGYETISTAIHKEKTVAEPALPDDDNQSENVTPDAPQEVVAADDDGEEQRQDAYTAISDAAYEDPFAVLNDTEDICADELSDAPAADVVTEKSEEDSSAVSVITATVQQNAQGTPAFADGTQPYKVVEKVVTETVKEIYKETPAAETHTGNDAVMEKLVDLLDYEIRSRRELELAEAAKNRSAENVEDKPADAVPTFATSAHLDDDDEQDEDDDELEDASGDADADDDDRDDEENDTDGDRFTGNERIIGFDEVTGCYIVAHYRKSFEAKLIQARPNIKKYYSDLKNALLSYKGTKNRISWTADSFHNGRQQIAKINVKTRILEIYFALDPASLDGTVYRGKDVGSKKKYADTPFQYKVRTPRKFKWAMELVQRVCEEHGLSPIDIEPVNYEALYPFDTTENLVERKLIKEYIRQEKPASSFELDPDHVPDVPQEDETVIPANANFSWEFDNDAMVEQEAEEQPETLEEPEVAVLEEVEATTESEAPAEVPAAAPVSAVASEATVVRETVKVTEVRYTERYYADAAPVYEQVVTTTEPIESLITDDVSIDNETNTELSVDSEQSYVEESEQDYTADTEEFDSEEAEEAYAEDVEEIYSTDAEGGYSEADDSVAEGDSDDDELFFGDEEVVSEEVAYESDEEDYVSDAEDDDAELETVEADEEAETEAFFEEDTREALPFRPSFYANRNYYADEEATDDEPAYEDEGAVTEEDVWDDSEVEAETEEVVTEDAPAYEEAYEEEYAEEYVEQDDVDTATFDRPAMVNTNPTVAVIDICALESYFEEGDMINIESLKVRELILPSATTLKFYASGEITKKFTVEANHFTLDAIQAISDADGDIVMVR